MRLSTPQIFDSGINGLSRNQYTLYRLQNQMASGRRVVSPEDDPVAAAQALATEQKLYVNEQFLKNQGDAQSQLKELESLMASVGEKLIDLKTRWVESGNGAYSDNELKDISVDVEGKFAQILSIANNTDAHGQYRFAGYQASTQPFITVGGSVVYQGDSGQRLLQVETSRFLAVNYSGQNFFQDIPQGNGQFVPNASAGNTGSGVISNGSVVGGNFDGNHYEISFTSPTTYDLLVNGTTFSTGNTYVDGTGITLGGAQISISGVPAAGDSFTVDPSGTESIFTTVQNFIKTLNTGGANTADFRNAMLRVGASLDQAIQHIADARAVVGARMAELDSLTFLDSDLQVQYKEQISNLVDLDYNKAVSDMEKNRLQLQAAQQSYLKVTNLSLFNYI